MSRKLLPLASFVLLAWPGRVQATDPVWSAAFRFQSSVGHDTNPLEQLQVESDHGDSFLRLLGEAQLYRRNLPGNLRGGLWLRGFTERYSDQTREARQQGEVRLSLDVPLRGRSVARAEAAAHARSYPDSTLRNYRRSWASLSAQIPLGPAGVFRPALQLWDLDYRRTPRRDQLGLGLDLAYEHPLSGAISAQGGLELGGIRHDRASIQLERHPDETEPRVVLGPDQSDNYRFLHLGFRLLKRQLVRLQYGYRSQRSNSLGSSFGRHELRWLVSRSLPLGCSTQFYGSLERTRYSDPDLDRYFILRSGEEEEAGDDNNLVALRLSRLLGRGWGADLRHTWYRNESLLVGDFYSKRVWSLGLSWERGDLSGF